MKLDKIQQKIIKYNNDLLVLAPAGSGKTFCITEKVNYLIKNNIDPHSILVISFTNETVNDLKKKINNENVFILTFHKLAIYILNKNNINYKLCNESLLDYIINEYFYGIINKNEKIKLCIYFGFFYYKNLLNSNSFKSFKKTIKSFIKRMQCNNYDLDFFINKKNNFLINIIIKIYYLYKKEKESTFTFDLDDLIIQSKKYVLENLGFKYIFVDEFQDTSLIRFNLIYEIYNKNDSKLFLFGDDFQSIYHFSGCDLNIMLNIKKYLPNIKIIPLRKTYRNSNELIKIANNFILKNKKQIYKKTYSNISIKNPIKIIYYKKENEFKKLINKLDNPLVLGRNNYDIFRFDNYNEKSNYKYLTIHKSKGLENKDVVIINLTNNLHGIPSKEKKFFENYFSKNNETIKYAEERRLFYVALTRAKEYVYLFVPLNNKSVFIKEIEKLIKRC